MKKVVYLLPFLIIVLFLILLKTNFYFRERFYSGSQNGIITTIAGTGTAGYSGDGGPATNSALFIPFSITVDSSGNVYIADLNNNRIRKINTQGVITTIAGTGTAGYSGDGGPATNAQINNPYGITVDSSGNVYISDTHNNRIRMITASTGIIRTIAGTGTGGYSGDGGPATNAQINNPHGITVDNLGNVYIAESNNNRIRKINTQGVITTIAGTGTRGYSGDGGPATNSALFIPLSITVDSSGNVYIADSNNFRIRKITASTGIITTIAGTGTNGYSGDGGPATSAEIKTPRAVNIDSLGNVYIVDTYNNRIRKINTNGIITTIAGTGTKGYSGDGGPAINAQINRPCSIAIDSLGNVYIADTYNNRIRMINSTFDKKIMSKTDKVPSEYYKGVTKHYPQNRILGTWKFWKRSRDFVF